MPTAHTVDVVVIGLGPGGEALAGTLAAAGLEVVGIENRLVGGECPYWACVPTKMMARAAGALAEARRVAELAGTAEVHPDFALVAQRIRDEATDDWDDAVAVERLEKQGCRFVRGTATITARGEVTVGDQVFTARRGVVVATGTSPAVPPIEGLDGVPYWTNREAVKVTEAPPSLVVLGGGVVGVELAQVFSRFGTQVTVVEAADSLVLNEEPEAGALLASVFEREGIGVHTGAKVTRVSGDGEGGQITVEWDGGKASAAHLLVATGRRNNLAGLGLEAYGLDPTSRMLNPDDRMRVTDGLWAIGDITGKGAFTHMSMYQAAIAGRSILGQDGEPARYHAVPRVTFTDPEIGSVGMTQAQARDARLTVRTGTTQVPSSSRGWIHKAGNDGFIKVVMDTDRGVLVGATSVGPTGGEVLSMLALAVQEGTPVAHLRNMIYAYPTFYRAIEDALRDLG